MKRGTVRLAASIAAAAILALPSSSQQAATVELLVPGLLHGDEVRSEGGPHWWALFETVTGSELRRVDVSITREHDPIVDAEGEATGKLVSVNSEETPVMLFKGLPGAKAGPVPSMRTENEFPYPGQRVAFEPVASQRLAVPVLAAYGEAEDADWGPVIRNYRLVLNDARDPSRRQTIVERSDFSPDEGFPHVVWAGDLDDDGRLDLLLDLTTHYNVSAPTLYLSSLAAPGEFVGLAGQITLTGC